MDKGLATALIPVKNFLNRQENFHFGEIHKKDFFEEKKYGAKKKLIFFSTKVDLNVFFV